MCRPDINTRSTAATASFRSICIQRVKLMPARTHAQKSFFLCAGFVGGFELFFLPIISPNNNNNKTIYTHTFVLLLFK